MPANWYRVNSNGTTVKIKSLHRLNSNGTFAKIQSIFRLNSNGTLAKVFGSILSPSIQTRVEVAASGGLSGSTIMNDSSSITLTSTRYHWLDADGFTYIWQKSANNSTWTNIGTAQSTTNPASGASSSSITRTLSASDFTSGSDMYFRFVFSATNSTYGTSASSESLPLLISYYGTPAPAPGSPSITGSTTVGNTAYGNIGTWTNSPNSYDYRWFFNAGLSSYPLTFSQARSISNKYLSGFSAALVTTASHGYKANDTVIVSGMDSLFNGSHTITLKTNNTIYFTIPTPTAWANAGTPYSSGAFVSYLGNAYAAASTITSVSAYNGGTTYSSGQVVYSGNNRYQSNLNNNIGNSVTNPIYWNPLGSYAPGGSQWTLQSFSNTAASGTTTAPNYYEGTVASSTSISLTTPTTDYKTSIDLRGSVLGFGVNAYNQATLSPSEYTATAFIYGYPVITIGTIVPGSTSASIPYTQSYMTSYDIDIKYLGSSISGYPATVSSPSSPISVTGLLAPRTYAYTITPKNGEGVSGTSATGTFATVAAPTISGISVTDTTLSPDSATGVSTSSSSNVGTTSWTNGSNTSFANLYSVTGSGTGGAGVDPTSLATSGTFTITSSGNASITIRSINNVKTATVTWAQTNAQSYTINYSIGGLGAQTPVSANSSASNPSVLLYSSTVARSVTINSITVYPQTGQQGTGVTLSSTSTVTPANKATNTSATNAVTYTNLPGYTPTISAATSTADGFTAQVTNYSASYNWFVATSAGSVSFTGSPNIPGATYNFTVTGLSPGQSATVTVTTTRIGYNNGSATRSGTALPSYTITFASNGYLVGSINTFVTSPSANTVRTGIVGQSAAAPADPTPSSGYTFAGFWRDGSPQSYVNQVNSGGSWTITATNKTFNAYYNAIVPNISSITVTGNGTAGVTCSAVMTNTFSVEYVLYCRDTTTSAWVQKASGTASANGTSLTTTISTTLSQGTLPDQYYVTMTPYFGARSTAGTGGGTGTAGTQRSTIGSPKSNAAGSITVNY